MVNAIISTNPVNLFISSFKTTPMNKIKTITLIAPILFFTLNSCKKDSDESTSKPTADFSIDIANPEVGEEITFSNNSSEATNYLWKFGDEEISSKSNPVHTYYNKGSYQVTLYAYGNGGVDSLSNTIDIIPPNFNIEPGKNIGVFFLGSTIANHFSRVPEQDVYMGSVDFEDGTFLHLLELRESGISFITINDIPDDVDIQNDISVAILAYEPFICRTAKSISFGSTFDNVIKAYGEPEAIDTYGNYTYYSLGISFWANEGRTVVDKIFISEPEVAKSSKQSAIPFLKSINMLKSIKEKRLECLPIFDDY